MKAHHLLLFSSVTRPGPGFCCFPASCCASYQLQVRDDRFAQMDNTVIQTKTGSNYTVSDLSVKAFMHSRGNAGACP